MNTLEELRRRIKSVEDMQSVVSTMKTLAAARIRQFETAASATDVYSRTINMSLQILMMDPDKPKILNPMSTDGPSGCVLFGSDQGFCGRFNETIVEATAQFVKEIRNERSHDQWKFLVVGEKMHQLLRARGIRVSQSFRLPNSIAAMAKLIQQVIVEIDRWQSESGISRVELLFNRRDSVSTYALKKQQLLPLSTVYLAELGKQPWPSRSRPICAIPWRNAFSQVVQQYLYLRLFRAAAESLASENASRIAAMQKAESNIGQRLESLNIAFNESRQRLITEELLEIISGFEVGDEEASWQ